MAYILYTDETNRQEDSKAKFFIYGGIFLPIDKLNQLHELVEEARNDSGFLPCDELKFNTNSCPRHLYKKHHLEAKSRVLEGCKELGVKFIAYIVLHVIAKKRSPEQLINWGADSVLNSFHKFLDSKQSTGICILDRLGSGKEYPYIKNKFQSGLSFHYGAEQKLSRIHLFASSCVGASHISSAIDIVLGAFRYCVNERRQNDAIRKMFPIVANMIWYKEEDNVRYIKDYGLIFSPRNVQVAEYKQEYNDLVKHLVSILEMDEAR